MPTTRYTFTVAYTLIIGELETDPYGRIEVFVDAATDEEAAAKALEQAQAHPFASPSIPHSIKVGDPFVVDPTAPTDDQMRAAANKIHGDDGVCEVDHDAPVSRGSGNPAAGAYVQAWVWVDDEDAHQEPLAA